MNDVSIIEPEKLEYLPAKTLLRLVEKSQQASKNSKAFKQTVTALPGLFRALEEMDIEPRFDLDNEWIALCFTGDGNKLGAVWGLLRRHGYKTSLRPNKGESQFNAFWDCEGNAQLFMMFSSSVCRRVQVGTKTVQQPIYEVQCGELPQLEIETSAVVTQLEQEITF